MNTTVDGLKAIYERVKQYHGFQPQTIFAPKGFGDAVKEAAKAIGMYIKVVEAVPVSRCDKPRKTTYKTVKMDCAKRNR